MARMTAPSSRFDIDVFVFGRTAPLTALETCLARMRGGAHRTRAGKPVVRGVAAFSFSDSDGARAYLIANRKYVALDVELRSRADLAQRRVRLAPLLSRTDCTKADFLTLWVAKEACAKALGIGLLRALPRLSLNSAERACERMQTLHLHAHGRPFVARCIELPDATLGIAWRRDYGEPCITLRLASPERGFPRTVLA